MKNIQVIDGAENCVYDIFTATDQDYIQVGKGFVALSCYIFALKRWWQPVPLSRVRNVRGRSIRTKVQSRLCVLFSTAILCSGAARLVWGAPLSVALSTPASVPITAPLRAFSTNPHYFTDGTGKAIYLTGSHTWNNLQDWGTNGSIQPLDFAAYVRMLVAHHHNFTLLWATELPTVHGLPTTASSPPDFRVVPQPWQRTGPGNASDGKLKFDLTKFNQAYFDRLRTRVEQLNAAGIYAGVYFFTGEFLNAFRFSSDGYPFTGSNNVNGIDDGGGIGSVTMTAPNTITGSRIPT